jgi:hypothetical protein
MKRLLTLVLLIAVTPDLRAGETRAVNYDESKIPPYTLPDPLTFADGTTVTNAMMWTTQRRPEILRLFQTQVYGFSPKRPAEMKFTVTAVDKQALGGTATRKEVAIAVAGQTLHLLLYLPNSTTNPVPAFLGLNFLGNHAMLTDPGITLSQQWIPTSTGVVDHHATEAARGTEGRCPVAKILARGYAVATVYCGDIEPDFPDGWQQGVRGHYQQTFTADEWGAISAWAWGLSRALDYLVTDRQIDAGHVAVFGHSRLGKTALWAGAQDERFALVISNESGEGGAALARRGIGETTAIINQHFPHWFCGNFKQYADHEEKLPVEQHELIALVAPRPVYVASAVEDRWADPRGEFLAALNAEPVYRLLGRSGLGVAEMPAVNQPVGGYIGYHIRPGKHDMTDYDWEQYLNFADRHFR